MSAEQLRGDKTVDHRTDQYAFGVMLYLVLSGRMPFDADTLGALAMRVATESPVELSSLVLDLDPPLSALVMRALHRDREQRFATLTELRDLLAPYADQGATLGTPGVGGPRSYQSTPNAAVARSGASSAVRSEPTPRPALLSPRPATLPGTTLAQTGQLKSAPQRRWSSLAGMGLGGVALAAGALWLVVRPSTEQASLPPRPPDFAVSPPAPGAAVTPAPALPRPVELPTQPEPKLVPDSGTETAVEAPEPPVIQPATAERPRERERRHARRGESKVVNSSVAPAPAPEPATPKPVAAPETESPRAHPETVRPEVKRVGQIDVEEF
jgi:serine/threonine protein kinase